MKKKELLERIDELEKRLNPEFSHRDDCDGESLDVMCLGCISAEVSFLRHEVEDLTRQLTEESVPLAHWEATNASWKKQKAENDRLRAVMEPFAREFDRAESGFYWSDEELFPRTSITYGDYRSLRDAFIGGTGAAKSPIVLEEKPLDAEWKKEIVELKTLPYPDGFVQRWKKRLLTRRVQ